MPQNAGVGWHAMFRRQFRWSSTLLRSLRQCQIERFSTTLESRCSSLQIPTIELAPKNAPLITEAAATIGFVYLTNCLPIQLVERCLACTKWLFSLSDREKRQMSRSLDGGSSEAGGYYRYEAAAGDKDFIEAFLMVRDGEGFPASLRQDYYNAIGLNIISKQQFPVPRTSPAANRWPVSNGSQQASAFRETMLEYFDACAEVSLKIMACLAESLHLPRDFFAPFHSKQDHILELKRYPPPSASLALGQPRIAEHCDLSSVTLLAQDAIGGLEVFNERTNEWIAAPARSDTILVNIGDFMHAWTGGQLRSTSHRVVASQPVERYSVVFFATPNWDVEIRNVLRECSTQSGAEEERFLVGDKMPF